MNQSYHLKPLVTSPAPLVRVVASNRFASAGVVQQACDQRSRYSQDGDLRAGHDDVLGTQLRLYHTARHLDRYAGGTGATVASSG